MTISMTWQITIAVVDKDKDGCCIRFYRSRLKRRAGKLHLIRSEEETDAKASFSRPVAVMITGSTVSSKNVTERDPAVSRIMKSGDLYLTLHTDIRSGTTVDFIRKDSVSEVMAELERKSPAILGILVAKQSDSAGRCIENICDSRLTVRNLPHDLTLLSALCSQIYMKLRLPLLLAYLCILAANWIAFGEIGSRLQEKKVELESITRIRKVAEESDSRQKSLEKKFMDAPNLEISAVSGEIAASVPDGIRFNCLHIQLGGKTLNSSGRSATVKISGETFDPGSIVELSDRLATDSKFGQADISSIETDSGNRKMLQFEIETGI